MDNDFRRTKIQNTIGEKVASISNASLTNNILIGPSFPNPNPQTTSSPLKKKRRRKIKER